MSSIPLRVALLGLPGAGKTTLATGLSRALGWKSLNIGDVLRAQVQENPGLAETLGAGQLAPESLVLEIVAHAVSAFRTESLVVDGFPRHKGQIAEADRLLGRWRAILLYVDTTVAVERLQRRTRCITCGFATTASTEAPGTACPSCGTSAWYRRAEDRPETVVNRTAEAACRLSELLALLKLRGQSVLEIDGSNDPLSIVEEVRTALVSY